jgi:predicted ATP-dependent protease
VILSSLSGIPLKQNLAITGSMDQHGEVQPIGGVNEKIEGFFDLCKVRGLDGTHGVVIPRKNMSNLMLKKEVVDAVKNSTFSIYAIDRVEEGVELFTGIPAGELKDDGTWPEGSVNYLVMKRLDEIRQAYKDQEKKEGQKDKENNNT